MKWINQYTGFLRTIRLLYWLNNFKNRKLLQRNKSIYKSFGIKQSVLKSIDSRILKKHVGDIRNFKPKGFENETPSNIEFAEQWKKDGFIILRGFLSKKEVEQINQDVTDGLAQNNLHYNYTGRKIFNAHQKIESIQNVAQHPKLLQILKDLFGRPAIHFQTISFNKGSEQQAHSDSIHMTTLPLGFLAGVWVALEEVNDKNGPLTYYPGSHKLPYILNDDYDNSSNALFLDGNANSKYEKHVAKVIISENLQPKVLHTQPGDVLIWHANLMHGGAPIKDDNATRKSMVFHYFAKDVLCFHEISERVAIVGK